MFGWTVDTANPTKPQLVTEYNCERCATLSVLVPVLPLLVMVLLQLIHLSGPAATASFFPLASDICCCGDWIRRRAESF